MSCSPNCPTGCRGRGDYGHREVIVIYINDRDVLYEYEPPPDLYDWERIWKEFKKFVPLHWVDKRRAFLLRVPRRMAESILIRWMAKALIGGQK